MMRLLALLVVVHSAQSQSCGTTRRAPVDQDTWLEGTSPRSSWPFLIIGKHTGYPVKRSAIKFNLDSIAPCQGQRISRATMNLRFLNAHQASGSGERLVERHIIAGALKVPWIASQANMRDRMSNVLWSSAGNFLADPNVVDQQDWSPSHPHVAHVSSEDVAGGQYWEQWDITEIVKDWTDGTLQNHGLVLWAVNENVNGRDLRFASNENSVSIRPFLEVEYTTVSSTCVAAGDPHYKSFDNVRQDFQGQCEYVFMRDCRADIAPAQRFEVHVSHTDRRPRPAAQVTAVDAVAIRIPGRGGGVLTMYRNPALNRFNGQPLTLPMSFGGNQISSTDGRRFSVYVASAMVTIKYNSGSVLEAILRDQSPLRGHTCGLCGNSNSVGGDDTFNTRIIGRINGTWQVTPTGDLATLFPAMNGQEPGTCTESELPGDENPCRTTTQRLAAERFCHPLLTRYTDQCDVSPEPYFEDCVFDYCGDPSLSCDLFQAYEDACIAAGNEVTSVVDNCGVCFGDGSSCGHSCSAYGDPHYRSFDSLAYNWQGQCEYVLAKDCRGDGNGRALFELQVKNSQRRPLPGSQVTVTIGIAVRFPVTGNRLVAYSNGGAMWNGNRNANFPAVISNLADNGGNVINKNGRSWNLRFNSIGATVLYSGSTVKVVLDSSSPLVNNTCGLCGDLNGIRNNDAAHIAMNDHWKVGPAAPLNTMFVAEGEEATECTESSAPATTNPCADPDTRRRAQQYCSALIASPGQYSMCHDAVDPEEFYDACIMDYCEDPSVACDVYTTYEDACTAAGVIGFESVIDDCGVCFGDGSSCGSSCSAYGDPHYRTFDSKSHNWQGQCEYVLTRDCRQIRRIGQPFEVQVKNSQRRPLPARQVTRTVGVAVRLPNYRNNGDIVKIFGGAFFNNGPMPALPYADANGNTITRSSNGRTWTIRVPSVGATVITSGSSVRVVLDGSSPLANTTCGLCADNNGASVDDASHVALNSHWKVGVAPSDIWTSFFPADGQRPVACTESTTPQETNPCGEDNSPAHLAAQRYCSALIASPGRYAACHDIADPQDFYDACVMDHCADPSVACDTFTAYEDECTAAGVIFDSVVDSCGVCFGDGSSCGHSCAAYGDPHYRTFDSSAHHWQGQCEYVLAKDCREGVSMDERFEVQVKNSKRRPLPAAQVTATVGVAIRLPRGATLQLGRTGPRFNGGAMPTLPYIDANGNSISLSSNRRSWTIRVPSVGATVLYTGAVRVILDGSSPLINSTCGLCGDLNGAASNDASHVALNSHWKVEPTGPLQTMFVIPGEETEVCEEATAAATTDPCPPNTVARLRAEEYCGRLISSDGPYSACHDAVDPDEFYESCVMDHCADANLACDTLIAYEDECTAAGVIFDSVVDSCGVCFGDGSSCGHSCAAYGDPHYRTFDSAMHHWQGQCEYVLAKDCRQRVLSRSRFEVQVKNSQRRPLPARQVTRTIGVAVRLPLGGIVQLGATGPRFNGGSMPALPYSDSHGNTISVSTNGRSWTIRAASVGATVFYTGSVRVVLDGSSPLVNATCGLCGDLDGSGSNDGSHAALNSHWKVEPNGNLQTMFVIPGQEPEVCTEATAPATTDPCEDNSARQRAEAYCSRLIQSPGPYSECHERVDPQEFYDSCVFDHCADPNVACDTYTEYEDQCIAAGAIGIQSIVDDCGVCFGDGSSCGSSCSAYGDPHYRTFDSVSYNWQGQCEYVLTKDCRTDTRRRFAFEVQVKNSKRRPAPAAQVTVTVGVAIRLPITGDVFELYNGRTVAGQVFNGGTMPALPYVDAQGSTVSVSSNGRSWTIRSHVVGATVFYTGSTVKVVLDASSPLTNSTCGLCGDTNGVPRNDRTHAAMNSYWKVEPTGTLRTMFSTDGDEVCEEATSPGTDDPCANDDDLRAAQAYCSRLTASPGPYSACHGTVDPQEFYDACVVDHCAEPSVACDTYTTYEDACSSAGVIDFESVIDSCGVCFGDDSSCGSSCHSTGDPHYQTFDGMRYNFMGQCEYILVKDCRRRLVFDLGRDRRQIGQIGTIDRGAIAELEERRRLDSAIGLIERQPVWVDIGSLFEVQTRNSMRRPGRQVTITVAVAVRFPNGDVVQLFRGSDLSVHKFNGGNLPTLPYTDSDGNTISVSADNTRFEVRVPSLGAIIHWSRSTARVVLLESSPLKDNTCGLCGNFDGDASNDRMADYPFKVEPTGTRPTLFRERGSDPEVCEEADGPGDLNPCDTDAKQFAAEQFCSALTDSNGRYSSCHAFVDPVGFFEDCVFDHCVDPDLACELYTDYESECNRVSINQANFRSVIDECGVCFGDGSTCAEENCASNLEFAFTQQSSGGNGAPGVIGCNQNCNMMIYGRPFFTEQAQTFKPERAGPLAGIKLPIHGNYINNAPEYSTPATIILAKDRVVNGNSVNWTTELFRTTVIVNQSTSSVTVVLDPPLDLTAGEEYVIKVSTSSDRSRMLVWTSNGPSPDQFGNYGTDLYSQGSRHARLCDTCGWTDYQIYNRDMYFELFYYNCSTTTGTTPVSVDLTFANAGVELAPRKILRVLFAGDATQLRVMDNVQMGDNTEAAVINRARRRFNGLNGLRFRSKQLSAGSIIVSLYVDGDVATTLEELADLAQDIDANSIPVILDGTGFESIGSNAVEESFDDAVRQAVARASGVDEDRVTVTNVQNIGGDVRVQLSIAPPEAGERSAEDATARLENVISGENLVVNWDGAELAADPDRSTVTSGESTGNPSDDSSDSTMIIVGVVIGVFVLAGIVVAAVMLSKKESSSAPPTGSVAFGSVDLQVNDAYEPTADLAEVSTEDPESGDGPDGDGPDGGYLDVEN